MLALRSHLALWLLLCFSRVLLPDTWVLTLHAHQHTSEVSLAQGQKPKALLTAKHQHCQTDHFCALPFQVAATWKLGVGGSYLAPRPVPPGSTGVPTAPTTRLLRGPPAQA